MPELSASNNSAIARIIAAQAQLASLSRDDRTAIQILDQICGPFRGTAPDWRAPPGSTLSLYTDPHSSNGFGTLLVEAFAPDGLSDLPFYCKEAPQGPAQSSVHWGEVVLPFLRRYGFRSAVSPVSAFPIAHPAAKAS